LYGYAAYFSLTWYAMIEVETIYWQIVTTNSY
jgi:hypothetical protein